MGRFEYLEHTADVGIAAYGATLEEAFAEAAAGLFHLIVDLETIRQKERREVEVQAPDLERLLVRWLNQLIYSFEVEQFLCKRCKILELDSLHLRAVCYGETVDEKRHPIRLAPKAATYHMLAIEQGHECRVQVVVDI